MTTASVVPNSALRISPWDISQSYPRAARARSTSRIISSIPRVERGFGAGGQPCGQQPLATSQVQNVAAVQQQSPLKEGAKHRITAQLAARKFVCECTGTAI